MFCERYKCEMPEKTCVLRQRRHIGRMPVSGVSRDPGCASCEQGRDIMKQYNAKEKNMESVEERKAILVFCDSAKDCARLNFSKINRLGRRR